MKRRSRPSARPSLWELVRSTAAIEVRAEDLLNQLGVTVSSDLSAQADTYIEEVGRRTAEHELFFPERFAVERETGRFLYLLVRATKPQVVVETGVANGVSTFLMLEALRENGSGRLVSVDITERVGALLVDGERQRKAWVLEVIEPGGLKDVLEDVGFIDIFIHDSDHKYSNAFAELTTAWSHVRPGGLLLSDDGEASFAFIDAVRRNETDVYALFDRRKLLMAARC